MTVVRVFYLLLLLNLCHSSHGESEDGPVVTIKEGKIRGFLDHSGKGRPFYQFRKIPYARPPIGELRLKDPEPAVEWNGVRDGTAPMVLCPQPDILTYMKNLTTLHYGQEDCLYLTIYTPKNFMNKGSSLPVLVHIHSGAFIVGGAMLYEGHDFLNEDVIMVSINYRLGVLGFMSTEDNVIPGNFGLKDQTLALRWIKENIKQFGGDSDRITIFGVSAGGASAHHHILSPHSRGLFQRAIVESGTMLCPWTQSESQREISVQVGAALGCFVSSESDRKFSKKLLECLQKVDAEKLTQTFRHFMTWNFLPCNFGPYIDGQYIPEKPEILLREGRHANVDIMIGVTRDEGALLTNSVYSLDEQRRSIESNFSDIGPQSLGFTNELSSEEISREAYQLYVGETRATKENADKLTSLLGDRHFKVCCDLVALFHAENVKESHKKVYYYELHHKGQRSLNDFFEVEFGKHWICHGNEIFYMYPAKSFGEIERNEEDSRMSDILIKLWVNFAETGNPTPDDSLGFKWEPFTKVSPRHLSLNLHPQMEDDTRQKVREFWNSLNTRQNMWLFGKQSENRPIHSEL